MVLVSRQVESYEVNSMDKPEKAYKNLEFLNSPSARPLRVLAEFLEPAARFKKHNIHDTIVFFGSARIVNPDEARKHHSQLSSKYPARKRTAEQKKLIKQARTSVRMSRYYEEAQELAKLLTDWSLSLGRGKRRFIVCSGGGPGIMEAANRGATENKKGFTVGLNISLPFEQYANEYITKDLSFEFHYFFIRKYWFLYLAKALVAFPGGFGTLDEFFEMLTLIQTEKTKKKLPIVVYGSDYWKKLINFQVLVDHGMIDEADLDFFHICDDPQEAFEFLKETLTSEYLKPAKKRRRK